jgi:hypothetical protein
MIHHFSKRVNTFFEQNVLMTAMSPDFGLRNFSGRGQRSTQQPAAHHASENNRLA